MFNRKEYYKQWRAKQVAEKKAQQYKKVKEMIKNFTPEERKEWQRKKAEIQKRYRHKKGINKSYGRGNWEHKKDPNAKSYTKEYNKMRAKKYNYNKKMAGELTIHTIKLVYEDNIKKYGTLTCYLCRKPIDMQLKFFNKLTSEHLEHKIPLSRGGKNDYENLGIACCKCNVRKRNKTVSEYKKYLKINGGQ